ncbi:unnamed protein product [Notodromas monacha]|uniref:Cysteine/serine-rich nuclear protein N-terminal domain-containing protein n=1 Tax=Notodromas monacha TaxID=399045 RepID=A0A7R9GJP3_9CRUS|nr:unnamed protein product [Notodromas monacha]CAG0925199.1 unnamed protein product [Notodromas monacha]
MPMTKGRRRALLRKAGVKFDHFLDLENTRIAESRKQCGCDCKGGCKPDKCLCSMLEVCCLVDSEGYPCSCSPSLCQNPWGCERFEPVKFVVSPLKDDVSDPRFHRDPEGICLRISKLSCGSI